MFWNKGSAKKKDPKKVASMLRQAIAGEELVKEPLKGFDLSKLSTDQLKRLWEIKSSDLSHDEKCTEVEKMLNAVNGVERITGFKMMHNGEVVHEVKAFKWFEAGDHDGSGKPRASWFREDNETESPGVTTPKPEPP